MLSGIVRNDKKGLHRLQPLQNQPFNRNFRFEYVDFKLNLSDPAWNLYAGASCTDALLERENE